MKVDTANCCFGAHVATTFETLLSSSVQYQLQYSHWLIPNLYLLASYIQTRSSDGVLFSFIGDRKIGNFPESRFYWPKISGQEKNLYLVFCRVKSA